MRLNYYNSLDGVRGIAALMVMFFHYFTGPGFELNSPLFSLITKLSVYGQTGVTLFFVLSGFLITRILVSTKNNEGSLSTFYIRRVIRIFPLYYLFLLLYYYLIPILSGTEIPSIRDQLYYYFYLQTFSTTFDWNVAGPGHFWSLAVEEHFYLFWPIAVYFFSIRNLYRLIWGIILGAFWLRFYMQSLGFEVYYFTFTRMDSLAIGALLALVELDGILIQKKAKFFLILTSTICLMLILSWVAFSGSGNVFLQVFKYDLLSFTFFSMIAYLICSKEEGILNKILTTPISRYTGRISYGLYVYHPFAFMLAREFFRTKILVFDIVIGLFFTYLLATLSYFLFEERVLSVKRYFEYDS